MLAAWQQLDQEVQEVRRASLEKKNVDSNSHPVKRPRPRDTPNVIWLAVPEDHLRAHPLYFPLPPAECINSLASYTDFSTFRQESWQWDVMHQGRITTSKCAAVVGILDKGVSQSLRIPRSLCGNRKARHAYEHLRGEPAFRSLDQAREVLLEHPPGASAVKRARWSFDAQMISTARRVWGTWRTTKRRPPPGPWARRYTHSAMSRNQPVHPGMVRMAWGNVHEPTAVLVALNYFHAKGISVSECGMYPGESITTGDPRQLELIRKLEKLGCPIGATPDGVLTHEDGSVEALEVKNHAPFTYLRDEDRFVVRDREPSNGILPWMVPQLQLEMFCMGPDCQSCVLVRLTATKGAYIVRLQRDDAYITLMLERMVYFCTKFVREKQPPGPGWVPDGKHLAAETVRVASLCVELATLQRGDVQRAHPNNLPLFC